MNSSIYKEHGLSHAPIKSNVQRPAHSFYRVKVVYKETTEYFSTHASSGQSAKNNAVYRFAQKHIQKFDNRDFTRCCHGTKQIVLNTIVKEVFAQAKINIVE